MFLDSATDGREEVIVFFDSGVDGREDGRVIPPTTLPVAPSDSSLDSAVADHNEEDSEDPPEIIWASPSRLISIASFPSGMPPAPGEVETATPWSAVLVA